MGGVWEQQVRSARAMSILRSLLRTHREFLDDESSLTIMTEIEGILNFRSLTVEVLNHPTSLQPLSPVNILSMQSRVVSPHQKSYIHIIVIVIYIYIYIYTKKC